MAESMNKILVKDRRLLSGSRKPEILATLGVFNITPEYLDTGDQLFEDYVALADIQKKEKQEKNEAYDIFHDSYDANDEMYKHVFQVVDILSRNDKDLRNRLKLEAGWERRLAERIAQGLEFYKALSRETAFLVKLARYNITAEQINLNIDAYTKLRILHDRAVSEDGESQVATSQRNQKWEELNDFCYELRSLAELALKGNPQMLEELGILVRS